jgi:hypothetical protein
LQPVIRASLRINVRRRPLAVDLWGGNVASSAQHDFLNLSSDPHLYQLIGRLHESAAEADFVLADENVYSFCRRPGTHGAGADAASVTWAT